MIRQVVFAITLAGALVAQRPASSDLVDLLVFGNHTLREGRLKGFAPELQAAVDAHILRAARYRSKLVAPKELANLDGMVYEAHVGYERLLASATTDPRGPELAADYVLTLRPCYEWEGYHDCPEGEAVFADRYQATHPDGPFKDFLPLFAAHRWLCAADAYNYEKKPDEERRARESYAKDIAVAKTSASLLMRAGAEGLAERGSCLPHYPEGHIVARVTDSTGGAMPGVTIVATPPSGPTLKCVTDVRGGCGFVEIQPQHYRLEASLSGFVTQNSDVDLVDGQFYQWNVKLAIVPMRGFEDLVAHVTKLTGANPTDCGRLRAARPFTEVTADQARPAVACAAAAARQGKSFWTSIQHPGIDSLIIEGLFASADGVIYRFEYDSAPCGGPGCASRFAIVRCPNPFLLGGDERATFACSAGFSG